MKKILYISHIDWDWIKQRPQFVAEELATSYKILVLYGRSLKRSNMVTNPRNGLEVKPFLPVPFYYNLGPITSLFEFYLKIYFNHVIKTFNPDYVWLTFPIYYKYLPSDLEAKIIYDCMDDATEFTQDNIKKKYLLTLKTI